MSGIATPATVQSITLADLRTICADLTREFPAAGSRVEKGAMIFLFRHVGPVLAKLSRSAK